MKCSACHKSFDPEKAICPACIKQSAEEIAAVLFNVLVSYEKIIQLVGTATGAPVIPPTKSASTRPEL